MKGKTIFVNLLSFMLLMLMQYSNTFHDSTKAWVGIVIIVLTALLNSDFFKSGSLPSGWNVATYCLNGAMLVVQIINALSEKAFIPVDVANYLILGINTFIMVFIKDYGNKKSILQIFVLLFLTTAAFSQTPTAGRIWRGKTPPIYSSLGGKFTKADLWRDTVSHVYYAYNGGWYIPEDQLVGPVGPQGPYGPMGPAGKCPDCPTTSGGTVALTDTSIHRIGKIAICYNEKDVSIALNDYKNNKVSAIWIVNDIGTLASFDIPWPGQGRSFETPIFGWGNIVYDNTKTGLPYLFGRKPINQTYAKDTMQGVAVVMKDLLLKGAKDELTGDPLTGTLLDIGATYGSNFDNVDLQNAKNGFMGRFCMMSEYQHSKTVNVRDTIFAFTTGNWQRSSPSNSESQSNSSLGTLLRGQSAKNGKVSFYDRGSSNVWWKQCVSEQDSTQYAFLSDDAGASTARNCGVENIHIEQKLGKAGVERRSSANELYTVNGMYSSYANNILISSGSSAYGIMKVMRQGWIETGSKYQTSGGVIWDVSESSFGEDLTDLKYWVNGTLPNTYSFSGYVGAPDNSGVMKFLKTSKYYLYAPSMNFFGNTITLKGSTTTTTIK